MSRRFIGTGTGFAPLYHQITAALARGDRSPLDFIFGVRSEDDVFYLDVLDKLHDQYPHFSYTLCLSQGTQGIYSQGRVTDILSARGVGEYSEYYMCGNPKMVQDVRTCLMDGGVGEDRIFFEQY